MIGEINGSAKRVTFMPTLRGFSIETGPQRRVIPVSDGAEYDSLFQPRAVEREESLVSPIKKVEAQRTWKSMITPTSSTTAVGPFIPGSEDPVDHDLTAPAQTFPMSPSAFQDLKNREKLYGNSDKP
jgi:hypothetical protein